MEIGQNRNQQFEEWYRSIGKVYCPYFKGCVHFTRTGLEHLKLKNKYKARPEKDKLMRMKMLPTAIKILGSSHTLQNKTYRRRFEERYINNRKEVALTNVTYYEFIAIVDERRIRVVLKQVENEHIVFLSVIPCFKQKMPPEESDML